MRHELICSWLGLAEEDWPPTHYQLLGLAAGEEDAALIEQRVQQRLDFIRRYQMMHPEQATEAMNRLAQAFACLTEPRAKKEYDAALLGATVKVEPPAVAPSLLDTVVGPINLQQTWTNKAAPAAPPAETRPSKRTTAEQSPTPVKPPPLPPAIKPPPLPAPVPDSTAPTIKIPPMPPLPPPSADPAPTVVMTAPARPVVAPAPPRERVDPILEAARSPEARRGLGSRRAIYRRLLLTRRLLQLWDAVGKHVSSPHRKLKRSSSAEELDHDLLQIIATLQRFPPCLGRAGQPGYLVVSLEKQEILETFQSMDFQQRQSLSLDWQAGRKLLLAHVAFLRQESRFLRRQTFARRIGRAIGWLIFNRPGQVSLWLSFTVLTIALGLKFLPRFG